MSMHLEGPWLSTTGKKKGKKKFKSAAHAAKAREQDESWKELLKRHGVQTEERNRSRAMAAETYKAPAPYRRETPHIASLNSKDSCGVATVAPAKVYTGTMVKGIATMHKSNAVPVFSQEDAIDISKMRR
jgi:hypothetical protein